LISIGVKPGVPSACNHSPVFAGCQGNPVSTIGFTGSHSSGRFAGRGSEVVVGSKRQLFLDQFVTGRQQRGGLFGVTVHVEEILHTGFRFDGRQLNGHILTGLRCQGCFKGSLAYFLTVADQFPLKGIRIFKVNEEIVIEQRNDTGIGLFGRNEHVLIDLLHLHSMRMGITQGVDHTVDAEVFIVMVLVTTYSKIASVSPEGFSIAGFRIKTLVNPVPNETTLEVTTAADDVPVHLEITLTVAHGVCVFTHDEGAAQFFGGPVTHVVQTGVHGANDVCPFVFAGTFKLNGAAGIISLGPGIHFLVAVTEAVFVTHGPENDACVVLVAFHEAFHALHVYILPIRVLGSVDGAIVHGVCLNIGLIHHIKSVFIAQLIKQGGLWVMAGTDGVDIELFHHGEILDEHFTIGNVTVIRMVFMDIDALEQNSLAIDQYLAVFQFDGTEAYFM